jgi:hypothetical protein
MGEIYIFFSRDDMERALNLSDKSIKKIMDELKAHELIQEERQGQGKANRIYLLVVETAYKYEFQNRKNSDSESVKTPIQESENVRLIKKSSKQDLNYIESHSHSHVKIDGVLDLINNKNKKEIEELLKSRVEYDSLVSFFGWETQGVVDEIVRGAVEVLADVRTAEFAVAGRNIPAGYVKEVLLNLEYDHISHVITKFREQEHSINHKKTYIRTMLYNSYYELNLDTSNRISRDFGGRAHRKK